MKASERYQIRRGSAGVSLLEVVVVAGIISILAALVVAAAGQIGGSQSLTSSAQMVSGKLDLARQMAMSENMRIEFRIYDVPETPGTSETKFQVCQIFRVSDDKPAGNPLKLPSGIEICDNSTYSSLLDTRNRLGGEASIGGHSNVNYKAIMFKPDGSTHLSPDGPDPANPLWTLTLVQTSKLPRSGQGLPPNFATIAIDPVSGRPTIYRP